MSNNFYKIYKKVLEKCLDLYLYYWKGIEDGPRIEKRMLKFQKKVQRMMKRKGITLVAYKLQDGNISMSYVPEQKWDEQQEKVQQQIMDEMMKEKGDEVSPAKQPENEDNLEQLISPENHL